MAVFDEVHPEPLREIRGAGCPVAELRALLERHHIRGDPGELGCQQRNPSTPGSVRIVLVARTRSGESATGDPTLARVDTGSVPAPEVPCREDPPPTGHEPIVPEELVQRSRHIFGTKSAHTCDGFVATLTG